MSVQFSSTGNWSSVPSQAEVVKGTFGTGRQEWPSSVHFEQTTASGTDFSGCDFNVFSATDATFDRCSFADVRISFGQLGLKRTIYTECTFKGADLRGIDPGDAVFERCEFADTLISKWWSFCAEFVDCRFATRIVDSVFSATPQACTSGRARNRFRGNDFSGAELHDTMFIGGIDLDDQRWPESDDYVRVPHAASRVAAALETVEAWREPDRSDALVELQVLARFAENQVDLLIRPADMDLPAAATRRLCALLRATGHGRPAVAEDG
jgi:hypothetical protein